MYVGKREYYGYYFEQKSYYLEYSQSQSEKRFHSSIENSLSTIVAILHMLEWIHVIIKHFIKFPIPQYRRHYITLCSNISIGQNLK